MRLTREDSVIAGRSRVGGKEGRGGARRNRERGSLEASYLWETEDADHGVRRPIGG